MAETYLAQAVEAADKSSSYDTNAKFLLADKQILAWILKYGICMDREKDGDAIEEISLERRTVFGGGREPEEIDLVKGVIIHVRSDESLPESQNMLVSMLEKLLSGMGTEEKKQVLEEKYGMVMTAELERRVQTMCNLSEDIFERGMEQGIEQGIDQHLAKLVRIKIGKGKTVAQIAEELEETEEQIKAVIERMQIPVSGL